MITRSASHQPVMGTVFDTRITATSEVACAAAEEVALSAALANEATFTVFDPASELCRWRRGEVKEPSQSLAALLALAHDWQQRSGGAFNPAVGLASDLWSAAADEDALPDPAALAAAVAAITELPYERQWPHRPAPHAAAITFNAIAKGHVVDLAAAAALSVPGVAGATVSAGGDLACVGSGSVRVGVEDPHRSYDNTPPLTAITLTAPAALATSGGARRGFTIKGRRYSHLLDPRTGQPVEHTSSATVVAHDATTAEVLATIASVTAPKRTVEVLAELAIEAACLIVTRDGTCHTNDQWLALAASPTS